ncbi:hypothetical protein EJB05_29153, partial [Eragrostis curvula]
MISSWMCFSCGSSYPFDVWEWRKLYVIIRLFVEYCLEVGTEENDQGLECRLCGTSSIAVPERSTASKATISSLKFRVLRFLHPRKDKH